jgi:hypothetical protein
MYADCHSIGLVYVFMAEGYQAILSSERPWEGLDEERVLREHLEKAVRRLAPDKIQIVGTRELTPTMASLSRMTKRGEQKELGDLLLGSGRDLNYDSPKVVEAMIRLARATKFHEEPIFRFDADVEVDDENVLCLLNYYDELATKEQYYFFSGGYRCSDPASRAGSLLNAYAVRTAQFWKEVGGVGKLDTRRAKHFLDDLRKIGADPYTQVISGAGLCMSPSAIQVLPPFANVAELIIWIDDHLKRVLHEDMKHFGRPKGAFRRCCEAKFVQDRHPGGLKGQDVAWHSDEYLKRLVRGCLLDAMIQDRRPNGRGQVAGLVGDYVTKGLPLEDRDALDMRLKPIGVNRLELIEATWGQPVYEGSAVYDFAQTELPGAGADLVDEVIEAVDSYFALLETWSQFVSLCQQIDRRLRANQWLFRPVLDPP